MGARETLQSLSPNLSYDYMRWPTRLNRYFGSRRVSHTPPIGLQLITGEPLACGFVVWLNHRYDNLRRRGPRAYLYTYIISYVHVYTY